MKAWNKGPRGFWLGTTPQADFQGSRSCWGTLKCPQLAGWALSPGFFPSSRWKVGGPR